MIKIGSIVKFKPYVFGKDSPHYPYYEKYLGFSNFEVISISEDKGHAELKHPTVKVKGLVHVVDLILC